MKRICLLASLLALTAAGAVAQDPSVDDRLNRLSGQIDDILAAQAQIQKDQAALAKNLASLRDQVSGANGNYATQDDLRKVLDKLQEIDKKRVADNELITRELEKLGRAAATPAPRPRPAPEATAAPPDPTQPVAQYVVKQGDNLSLIAQACKEKGTKVTVAEILKANPGLDPKRLKVGQTIYIPLPKP